MTTICFTGFSKTAKNELIQLAKTKKLEVKSDVTNNLLYLCCGPNAGPSKMKKAKSNGTILISEDDFRTLEAGKVIDTAYMPSPAPTPPDLERGSIAATIYDEHPLLDCLWDSIDNNKKITLVYHGGSNSGSERDLLPLSLNENFILRAVDLNTKQREVKSFAVEKIEIIGLKGVKLCEPRKSKNEARRQYNSTKLNSIGEVYYALKDTLDGMGWHVTTYHKDGECIRLDVCDYFKNGKPRKTPVVTLYFEPENKTRPYVCKCREIELANTYANLDNAALMFLNLAYEASSIDVGEVE